MYIIQSTQYTVYRVYNVQYIEGTLYNLHCALFSPVQCTVFDQRRPSIAVYIYDVLKCTVQNVKSTVKLHTQLNSVQCTTMCSTTCSQNTIQYTVELNKLMAGF